MQFFKIKVLLYTVKLVPLISVIPVATASPQIFTNVLGKRFGAFFSDILVITVPVLKPGCSLQ
jgi:hypothetical protein